MHEAEICTDGRAVLVKKYEGPPGLTAQMVRLASASFLHASQVLSVYAGSHNSKTCLVSIAFHCRGRSFSKFAGIAHSFSSWVPVHLPTASRFRYIIRGGAAWRAFGIGGGAPGSRTRLRQSTGFTIWCVVENKDTIQCTHTFHQRTSMRVSIIGKA